MRSSPFDVTVGLTKLFDRYEYTREGLTIEFRLQGSENPAQKFHFLWFYLYKQPGVFTVHYVNSTDKGANATVGVQGGKCGKGYIH